MANLAWLAAGAAALCLSVGSARCFAQDAGAGADEVVPPAPPTQYQRVEVLYNGRFIGLRVMKASVAADLTDRGYDAVAVFRTAGLAGMFNDTEITATGNGVVADALYQPREYEHKNEASKKDRLVRIETDGDSVTPVITPPFGSMGEPPATADIRAGAMDWLAMFLNTSVNYPGEACNRTVKIFDGKQRINLRMELVEERTLRTRAYRGPGYVCHAYYTPIAGFDPEDLADPEVYERPFTVWLTKRDDGLTIPVRIRARISGMNVAVEAKSFTISGERVDLTAAQDGGEALLD